MNHLNKTQAQARADQVRAFRAEQQWLTEQGLLTLPQDTATAIQKYHDELLSELQQTQDIDLTEQAGHLSLGMQIVSFLGATALAASLFFLFYQYWGHFSTVAQVMLLVAAPLLFLGVALSLQGFDGAGYYVKLAALVSFAGWLLNISMLGSIFNLTPSIHAFGLFAVYGFLLAYLFHVRLLLVAALCCSFIFFGAQLCVWMGNYWINVADYPEHFLLTAVLFFFVPRYLNQQHFDGFSDIYQMCSVIVFFIAVFILANWGQSSYLAWSPDIIEGLYQLLGFASSALLVLYGIRIGAQKFMLTGNVFFALLLCTKFFDWWWDWLPKYVFFLLIALTAILALVVFNRFRSLQQRSGKHE